MRIIALALCLTFTLAACGEKPGDTSPRSTDTSVPAAQPQTSQSVPAPQPAAPEKPMEERLFLEYANRAAAITKPVLDSVIKANNQDPRKIEAAMLKILKRHDTLVRGTLASKYQISMDSVSAIIARRNAMMK